MTRSDEMREDAWKIIEWALMVLTIEHPDLAEDAKKALEELR